MRLAIYDSADELARVAAEEIAQCVRDRPSAVMALPAGRTPIAMYEQLTRMSRAGRVDFSRATFFGIDEFVGLAGDAPASFRAYLERHLFRPLNVDHRRIHFPNGAAANLNDECERYERELDAAGGLDLVVLGIGANGHIGFNEPGDSLQARTHRVVLHEDTRRENAGHFQDDVQRVPREALSMGMATLLQAARIMLMAAGPRKAGCVERSVNGPLTPRVPASFLQLHPSAGFYLDREAASLLRGPAPEAAREE